MTVYLVKAFSLLELGIFFNRKDAEDYVLKRKRKDTEREDDSSEDAFEDYEIITITESQIVKLPYGDPLDGPPYQFLG